MAKGSIPGGGMRSGGRKTFATGSNPGPGDRDYWKPLHPGDLNRDGRLSATERDLYYMEMERQLQEGRRGRKAHARPAPRPTEPHRAKHPGLVLVFLLAMGTLMVIGALRIIMLIG